MEVMYADNSTPKKIEATVISVRLLLRHRFRQASFMFVVIDIYIEGLKD
jgi:hypothetical protein